MQKKTAATLTTLALIAAIAATGAAAATVSGPEASGATDGTTRTGGTSTVVQTTAATADDDGWQGQLPDADRFRALSDAEQRAVFTRVDRLIGDLRGTGDGAGLVAQLSGYRSAIERARG